MKKFSVITILMVVVLITACSDVKRDRGREYMPDMGYSRAYETYSGDARLRSQGINYTALPVAGTVKRGDVFPFSIPRDLEGDSVNYVASRQVVNPIKELDTLQLKEAERLYLINCGICHGTKLDGNGPLYNGGEGPYPAAPKNLVADPVVSVMPEGQMFYSVTYGKGAMGPYGPQLSTSQRWRIVHYVKTRQNIALNGGSPVASGGSNTGGTGSTQTGPNTNAATSPGKGNTNENNSAGTNLNATPAKGGTKQ